jgi:hypothetical protein
MTITVDPANKRIILDSASATAQSIYAAWVDWVVLSDNVKYPPAFSSVGGDSLGSGLYVPPYYFLLNGWRVRPMEASHNLTITGNLFVDGGGVPVVSTLGTFQVNVNYTVPVQAQGISTSGSTGPTSSEIASAVWQHATGAAVATRLAEAWGRLGLDPSKPLTTGETSITFGDIVMAMSGTTSVTVQRV